MSIAAHISAADIANEIRMLRQNHKKVIFVVEGKGDSKVLRIGFKVPIECLVICHGKKNVKTVCGSVRDQGCIFMIDKDFGDQEPDDELLIETDLHSIESYLICSDSVKAVAIQKLDRLDSDDELSSALNEITALAATLSEWKWALNQLGFGTIDETTVGRIITKSATYESGSLEKRIRQLNHDIKEEHIAEAKKLIAGLNWTRLSHENICPKIWGATFAQLSQKKFGRQRGNSATFEHVIELLVCCASPECFRETKWFARLVTLHKILVGGGFLSSSSLLDAA